MSYSTHKGHFRKESFQLVTWLWYINSWEVQSPAIFTNRDNNNSDICYGWRRCGYLRLYGLLQTGCSIGVATCSSAVETFLRRQRVGWRRAKFNDAMYPSAAEDWHYTPSKLRQTVNSNGLDCINTYDLSQWPWRCGLGITPWGLWRWPWGLSQFFIILMIKFFYINIAVFVEKLYQIWLHYLIARRRCDQNNLIQYGRLRNVEFTSGLHFDTFSRLGRQNASAYQILCKSVNISRSYDVSYIFKTASVRHFEFWKIQILDTFSRAESKSASAHQIWSKSDDRPRYCDKTEIQYGRRRHVEFTSGLYFDTFSRLGRQNASAYQISCKSVNISRSY